MFTHNNIPVRLLGSTGWTVSAMYQNIKPKCKGVVAKRVIIDGPADRLPDIPVSSNDIGCDKDNRATAGMLNQPFKKLSRLVSVLFP